MKTKIVRTRWSVVLLNLLMFSEIQRRLLTGEVDLKEPKMLLKKSNRKIKNVHIGNGFAKMTFECQGHVPKICYRKKYKEKSGFH